MVRVGTEADSQGDICTEGSHDFLPSQVLVPNHWSDNPLPLTPLRVPTFHVTCNWSENQ